MAEILLIALPKEVIDELFEQAEVQSDWFFDLHRIVYPDWDEWPDGQKCGGFPKVSKATNLYIHEKAMDFDRVHHPDVFAGGLWFNNGFSTLDSDVPDWKVRPAPVKMAA